MSRNGRAAFLLAMAVMISTTFPGSQIAMSQTNAADVTVAEAANGGTVQLAKGQNLVIRLPAQLGTGYSWSLQRSTGVAAQLVGSSVEDGQAAPGGMQIQVFVLKPTREGSGDLELDYRQPWMRDQPPAKTFTLHFNVH